MKELGLILRTTRESLHLTLDEIQERTKIRKRYLQAIEEGDFTILPGLVYARGFVKSYAEQLGLDGYALLREHGLMEDVTAVEPKDNTTETPASNKIQSRKKAVPLPGERTSMLPQVLMGVAIIAMLGVGYWALTQSGSNSDSLASPSGQEQAKQDPNKSNPATPSQTSDDKKAAEANKENEPLKPVSKDGNKSVYKVTGDALKIDVSAANGDCWLEIKVDGQTKISKLAAKGTSFSFEGSKEILVTSGFAPALSVKVNGQPVELEQAKERYDFLFQK